MANLLKSKLSKALFVLAFILLPSLSVQAKVEKIVALSPHAVELLYSLGVGDRILATTDYADYPEAAKNIERIGGFNGIHIERVLEINPDLIVVWEGGNKHDQIEQLKSLGFNVYATHPKKIDDVAKELLELGKLTGTSNNAQKLARQYRERLAQIKTQYAGKKAVKTFYQLWSQPLRTAAGDSWLQQMMHVCNVENIFSGNLVDYPQVSLENVIIGAPEAIIIPINKNTPQLPTHINWQDWPEIPAVKNDHIFTLDADLMHRSTMRALDGLVSMCEAIDKAR